MIEVLKSGVFVFSLFIIILLIWGILIKKKAKKELRLDADKRMQENPNCESTQILYEKLADKRKRRKNRENFNNKTKS